MGRRSWVADRIASAAVGGDLDALELAIPARCRGADRFPAGAPIPCRLEALDDQCRAGGDAGGAEGEGGCAAPRGAHRARWGADARGDEIGERPGVDHHRVPRKVGRIPDLHDVLHARGQGARGEAADLCCGVVAPRAAHDIAVDALEGQPIRGPGGGAQGLVEAIANRRSGDVDDIARIRTEQRPCWCGEVEGDAIERWIRDESCPIACLGLHRVPPLGRRKGHRMGGCRSAPLGPLATIDTQAHRVDAAE